MNSCESRDKTKKTKTVSCHLIAGRAPTCSYCTRSTDKYHFHLQLISHVIKKKKRKNFTALKLLVLLVQSTALVTPAYDTEDPPARTKRKSGRQKPNGA